MQPITPRPPPAPDATALAASLPPPRCVFVTGPRGAGKSRWLQERIRSLRREHPAAHCAVLLAEEGRTRWERFAREISGVAIQRLFLPCLCCPALADLPGAARALHAASRPEWLFLELPALAAAGLLGEFDRALGWPREVVLLLDAEWSAARRAQTLTPLHAATLALADRVLEPAPPAA